MVRIRRGSGFAGSLVAGLAEYKFFFLKSCFREERVRFCSCPAGKELGAGFEALWCVSGCESVDVADEVLEDRVVEREFG